MQVWTKKGGDGKTIVLKKDGDKDAGFMYFAQGRTTTETWGPTTEELTKEQVEEVFADYINGPKPAPVVVAVKCPHCGEECNIEAAPEEGKLDNYSIECPKCKKPWAQKLLGNVVSGPWSAKN